MIVIKSNLDGDLRRFTIDPSAPFDELCKLLAKLYQKEIGTFDLRYQDEEGDQIRMTSDLEFKEACRVCKPILRLSLTVLTHSEPKKDEQPSPPQLKETEPVKPAQPQPSASQVKVPAGQSVVHIQGRPIFVNKPKEDTSKKCASPFTTPIAPAPVPRQPVESVSQETPKPDQAPEFDITPYLAIADGVAKMCLNVSNALIRETSLISRDMSAAVQQTANQTTHDTASYSSQSVMSMDSPTRERMASLSNQALQDSHTRSTHTAASTLQHSNDTRTSIADIPRDVNAQQNIALAGLTQQISVEVANVVRQLLQPLPPQ